LSVRQILKDFPAALHHWEALNQWNLGVEAWRASIESRLSWY
jgi:hypothetical protein